MCFIHEFLFAHLYAYLHVSLHQSLLIVGPVAVRQERSANGSTESPTTAKAVYEYVHSQTADSKL